MSFVVYQYVCRKTGKSYIGKARSIAERWAAHVSLSRSSELPFHRALRKHGVDEFDLIVQGVDLSEGDAFALERSLIASLCTRAPNGYNASDGGEGNTGHRHSAETKQRISEALRRRVRAPMTQATKEKLRVALFGTTHSEDTKAKLRELGLKRYAETPMAPEARERAARKLRGRSIPDAAKANMRASALARKPMSDEHRANLSKSLRGHFVSAETRQKLALKSKGRKFSDEAREKMSRSAKERYRRVTTVD